MSQRRSLFDADRRIDKGGPQLSACNDVQQVRIVKTWLRLLRMAAAGQRQVAKRRRQVAKHRQPAARRPAVLRLLRCKCETYRCAARECRKALINQGEQAANTCNAAFNKPQSTPLTGVQRVKCREVLVYQSKQTDGDSHCQEEEKLCAQAEPVDKK